MTLTSQQVAAIKARIESQPHIPAGLGTEEAACTVAAINLALTGRLTDEVPACMSKVVGGAAIVLQDRMPDEMRNSPRYKALVPLMAGTGRGHEAERLAVLMDWMWECLAAVQPLADKYGFGDAWGRMVAERTHEAADAAARAARAAPFAASFAADAVAADAARAADSAAFADVAATRAADAAATATFAAAAWEKADPIGVLERMVAVGAKEAES